MRVFQEYSGPMANWPEVAEVPHVIEALENLHRRHHMVVATNASDSDATLVWKALKRVGLGEYFKAVFTSQELGSRKPNIQFFRQIEVVLDRPPQQMVLIGDSYKGDILGAKQAGWRAIWYNPSFQSVPALLPLQDGEVANLLHLPEVIATPPLPDYSTCLAWLMERDTPYNILSHIQLVSALAYQLALWLRARGVAVDAVLTQRGAMLHDLAKIDSIRLGKERGDQGDHALMAYEILLERNQPVLAEMANRHMPVSHTTPENRQPQTWEQKLVHFADKLAEGSRLVSIEERIAALQQRYPDFAQELEESQPVLESIQQEICQHLQWTPSELIEQLRSALHGT